MTEINTREIATDLILDRAREVDTSTISERLSDEDGYDDLTEDEQDALAEEIRELMNEATVTVELPGGERLMTTEPDPLSATCPAEMTGIAVDVLEEMAHEHCGEDGCPGNTQPYHQAAAEEILAEVLETTETRVYRAFAKADERGVKLDAMTMGELTKIVMVAIRGES